MWLAEHAVGNEGAIVKLMGVFWGNYSKWKLFGLFVNFFYVAYQVLL